MTKYQTLFRELIEEKEKIEEGQKVLEKRRREIQAMIQEIRKVQREMSPRLLLQQ